jgi:hypothetical protein
VAKRPMALVVVHKGCADGLRSPFSPVILEEEMFHCSGSVEPGDHTAADKCRILPPLLLFLHSV